MIKNESERLKDAILALLAGSLLFIPLSLWRGFAFSLLWEWFIVSTFAVQSLPVIVAAGILVLSGLFKGTKTDDGNGAWDTVFQGALSGLIAPAFAIGFGWVLTLFMGGA